MSQRNTVIAGLVWLIISSLSATTWARSIRVDSGDWDSSGILTGDTSNSIGFAFDALGVSSSSAQISADGSVSLSGGGQSVQFNPFFDPNQLGGGNVAQYSFATTNAAFNTPGVESGFRVSWNILDSSGALLNSFQLAMFELSSGMFAVEFNYDQLAFGDDGSQIGFATSLGELFDLPGTLGLSFADYMGSGDDEFSNNCAGTPNALACNNYFAGAFGPDLTVLPDTLGGFFRQIDSNGDPVQGRYLWLFEGNGNNTIPTPGTLLLVGLGIALLFARRFD